MPKVKFCICATCTHSDFPLPEEMPGTEYRDYQNIPEGRCCFMPPVPVVVPRTDYRFGIPHTTQEVESVFPAVSPVGRCSQWALEMPVKHPCSGLEASNGTAPVPTPHPATGEASSMHKENMEVA